MFVMQAAAQVAPDLDWSGKKLAETRSGTADDPPQHPEDQQGQQGITVPFVPDQLKIAELVA